MRLIHGYALGKQLCELFGIDPNRVEQISVLCHVNSPVTVEVSFVDHDVSLEEIAETFAQYRLVEIGDEPL